MSSIFITPSDIITPTNIITPANVKLIENILIDPRTGQWVVPILEFDSKYINPYIGEIDPLNEDPMYQQRVIDYFYTKLTEKWLFTKPEFLRLLKYFIVQKTEDKGTITLISDPEKTSDISKFDELDRRYIFKYIDKHLITRDFVEKVLREYVTVKHIKWYDLFNNADTVRDLLSHKLKKLIIETIYLSQIK